MQSNHVIIDGKRYGVDDQLPASVGTRAPDGRRMWIVTPTGHQHYFDPDTNLFEALPPLSREQVLDRYKDVPEDVRKRHGIE